MTAKKKDAYSDLTADILTSTTNEKKARQKISIDIDAELYAPFKRYVAYQAPRTMGNIIEELIRRYMEENAKDLEEWDEFAQKQRAKRSK